MTGKVKQKSDSKLAQRLDFETSLRGILVDIATRYVNLPPDELEETIHDSLGRIGDCTGADRAYVFDFDYMTCVARNTYEWCANGVPSQKARLQALPLAELSEAMELHRQGNPLRVDRVDELQEGPLANILRPQHIQSILVVPLMEDSLCVGSVGFDMVRRQHDFSQAEVELLVMFAKMLVGIRQRKKQEDQLRLHSLVLDQIADHVTITDLDGVIRYVNKAQCELFGLPTGELLGRSTKVYGEDPAWGATQEEIVRETNRQGQFRTEVVNIAADGSRHVMDCRTSQVLDATGRPVALCGIATDITERKQIEERLRLSEEKFSAIFRSSPNMVGLSDVETGVYLEVNQRLCDKLGYRMDEVLGRKPGEIGGIDPAYTASLRQRVVAGESIRNEELQAHTKLGKPLTLLLSAELLMVGTRSCILTVTVDITERRAMEERLRQHGKEQEILLRETHHRIKNNIASVRGLLSMQAAKAGSEEAAAILNEAIGRVDSMFQLYTMMVASGEYSRLEAGNYFRRLVQSIVDLHAGTVGLEIRQEYAPVILDSKRLGNLGIIINELLTNSIKHAWPAQGTLLIRIELRQDGDWIAIRISDNGTGMPESSNKPADSGFGLMLVGMLCEQLDGLFTMEDARPGMVSIIRVPLAGD